VVKGDSLTACRKVLIFRNVRATAHELTKTISHPRSISGITAPGQC
jgi:hypothetical protein